MARRPPELPREPTLTAQQLRYRIEVIQHCITDLEAFDPQTINKRYGEPQVAVLEAAIKDALSAAFGQDTPAYNRYSGAARLDQGPHTVRMGGVWGGGGQIDYEAQDRELARRHLAEGKPRSIALLQQAIRTLQNQLREKDEPDAAEPEQRRVSSDRRVFIVHGHDGEAREALARFLNLIEFEPIILHEQASQGRTVIEKVEAHGDVGFAVVLLTPDDVGKARNTDELEPRARQNVLLELGYFIGRLGRQRVCTFMSGEVKVPSDFAGVVWGPMDPTGGWRQILARELVAAGYEIDWNKVMR